MEEPLQIFADQRVRVCILSFAWRERLVLMCVVIRRTAVRGFLLEAPTAAFGWLQIKCLGTHTGHGSTGTRVGAGGWLRTWWSI